MLFYILFTLNLGLALFRLSRSNKWGEKTVLSSLLLFLLLTFAMHPWIAKTSWSLSLLEKTTLLVNLFWLAGGPFFFWLEKKKRERTLFQLLRNGRGPLAEIVAACRMLSEARLGALIAIQKRDSLAKWVDSAVSLEARIRKEIIFSIFTPPGALHDGGIIILGDRIQAAGAVFPLTGRTDIPTELGTRHRAGLGMSEATDAITIMVSEETGKISLGERGKLFYDVKFENCPELLESCLKNRGSKRRAKNCLPKLLPSSNLHSVNPESQVAFQVKPGASAGQIERRYSKA